MKYYEINKKEILMNEKLINALATLDGMDEDFAGEETIEENHDE